MPYPWGQPAAISTDNSFSDSTDRFDSGTRPIGPSHCSPRMHPPAAHPQCTRSQANCSRLQNMPPWAASNIDCNQHTQTQQHTKCLRGRLTPPAGCHPSCRLPHAACARCSAPAAPRQPPCCACRARCAATGCRSPPAPPPPPLRCGPQRGCGWTAAAGRPHPPPQQQRSGAPPAAGWGPPLRRHLRW